MPDAQYPTWLDRVPKPEDVRDGLAQAAKLANQPAYLKRAGGDERFALWLRIADQHAAAAARETGRPAAIARKHFPWRGAYISCWSPRGAAEAAHDATNPVAIQALRQAELTGTPAVAGAPASIDTDIPIAGKGAEL